MAAAGPADAYLSARDPVDEGDPIDPTDKDTLFIGLLRCISPTSSSHSATLNWQARSSASLISHLREGSKTTSILPGRFWMQPRSESWRKRAPWAGLVGGIVTRAGPVTGADVAPVDQETLARLHLRPVFVGIERDLIRAAIDAEPQAVRTRIADTVSPDEFARPDRAGGWIIPLGQERRIIGST